MSEAHKGQTHAPAAPVDVLRSSRGDPCPLHTLNSRTIQVISDRMETRFSESGGTRNVLGAAIRRAPKGEAFLGHPQPYLGNTPSSFQNWTTFCFCSGAGCLRGLTGGNTTGFALQDPACFSVCYTSVKKFIHRKERTRRSIPPDGRLPECPSSTEWTTALWRVPTWSITQEQ